MFKFSFILLLGTLLQFQISFAEHIEADLEEAPVIIVEEEAFDGEYVELDYQNYTEEELVLLRTSVGLTEVETSDSSLKAYKLREEGVMVVSNDTFSNALQARNFCSSISSLSDDDSVPYQLISSKVGLGVVFLGMPFSNIIESSIISKPVIDFEGMRTGVVFWTTDYSGVADVTKADQVFAFTDGNGAGAGDYQNLADFNERLIQVGQNRLALPAICIDQNLKAYLD